ncbi:N-acetylornithine carbamoyltransferase [Maribellus sp. CM-23]|uniref:N-acetylornithine carbamoyltransferase n=1 Tax=Maribellus sp. CM-23 TaxID=2781026 RepID=UPI001F1985BE|nr:N-acetylornithine carbamoyltransferase [Maribellus sp. CM-23]MCE4566265.1 N-acetylornithine carbamoyltransferase [Maribellus sp. CM-23]
MKKFISVKDLPSIEKAIETAFEVKKNPYGFQHLGKNKTMVLVFFNSSLRTRLSTQKAAMNMGMNTMVLNVTEDSWQLESEMGVVMDGKNAEHLREAIPVIGRYCDVIGVRAFAKFEDKEADYSERILNQFVDYAGVPVVSMEGATRHPLQSYADLVTIEEFKKVDRPKVVLTWAPHPRALPQAVANSFVEWMRETDYELVVTHPEGYELAPEFMGDVKVEYDQKKAFEGADFVYAKNWASYTHYGQILSKDFGWTVDEAKMALTNEAKFMHCLPVRRNVVVTDGVIDSPNSIVVEEAYNRQVTAQAVLKMILEDL